jgi:outer membrane protein
LTLEEAIRTALAQHPSLRHARQEIAAAEARTGQVRSNYYPQLSISSLAKQGLSGASGALGLRGLVTSPLFRDIGSSAAALQNLYDFGRTAHGAKAGEWTAVSLKHGLESQQALVTLNVQQAYYNTLEQQRLIKVAEETLAERQLTVRQAAAFYRASLKSKLDVTLAEVAFANAQLELVRARERSRTAFAELNLAMGVAGEPAYILEEPRITLEPPDALDTLLAEGQTQRPELSALDAQVRADRETIAFAESNRKPRLMGLFSGGWVRFSELTPGRLLLGAFGIDMPLFTGFRIENEIAEAKANLARTEAARDTLSQEIRLEVQRADNQLESAMESVRATEPLVDQARQALRLAQVRYRNQLGDLVELNTAQVAAAEAEAQHASAQYRYKVAEAVLRFVTGRPCGP